MNNEVIEKDKSVLEFVNKLLETISINDKLFRETKSKVNNKLNDLIYFELKEIGRSPIVKDYIGGKLFTLSFEIVVFNGYYYRSIDKESVRIDMVISEENRCTIFINDTNEGKFDLKEDYDKLLDEFLSNEDLTGYSFVNLIFDIKKKIEKEVNEKFDPDLENIILKDNVFTIFKDALFENIKKELDINFISRELIIRLSGLLNKNYTEKFERKRKQIYIKTNEMYLEKSQALLIILNNILDIDEIKQNTRNIIIIKDLLENSILLLNSKNKKGYEEFHPSNSNIKDKSDSILEYMIYLKNKIDKGEYNE